MQRNLTLALPAIDDHRVANHGSDIAPVTSLSNELTGITDPPAYRTTRCHFLSTKEAGQRTASVA